MRVYVCISLTAASAHLFSDCVHSVVFSSPSHLNSLVFSPHFSMAYDLFSSPFSSYLFSDLSSSLLSSLFSPAQTPGVSVAVECVSP